MKALLAALIITLLMGGVGMCGDGVIPDDNLLDIPFTESTGSTTLYDSSATIDWTCPAENVVFGEEEFLSISKDGIWTFRFDDKTELNLTREQVKGILSIMKRASIVLRLTGTWGFGLSDYLDDLELLP